MAGYGGGDMPAREEVAASGDPWGAERDLHGHVAPPAAAHDGGGPGPGLGGAAGVQVGSGNLQVNYFYDSQTRAGHDGTPSMPASVPVDSPHRGHAFISYVREDSNEVDALEHMLEAAGVPVWRDTASLWPGEDWHAKIRDAITRDALVFIACFSSHSAARRKSYMNAELLLAIDQLRLRQPDDPWLIPVRFDDCRVPDFELGPGRTLGSIHQADLFGPSRDGAAARLVAAVQRLLRRPPEGLTASQPARNRKVAVTAEWALRGKTMNDTEYRLLAHSDGVISARLFEEALQRYSPGMLAELPQVSISWLPSSGSHGRYCAIAIHQDAEDGRRDRFGRDIVFTRYFCATYGEFAAYGVSYKAMYEALRSIALPTDDGLPTRVYLATPAQTAHDDDEQVSRVAALLLTGEPVCILGAHGVSMLDRLRFINAVMAMLPYGMRSSMTASTWTSSTHLGHKFRLYFGDAPRQANEAGHGDRVVNWGHSDKGSIGHRYAEYYLHWLRNSSDTALLARDTGWREFSPEEVLKTIELIEHPLATQPAGTPTHRVVAAIDFGSYELGFAWTLVNETNRDITQREIFFYDLWDAQQVLRPKNLSALLLDKHGGLIDWGYRAQERMFLEGLPDGRTYVTNYKMSLQQDRSATALGDANQNRVLRFVELCLREVYKKALEPITASGIYTKDDIDWCITVPAVWNARTKALMVEAALHAGLPAGDDRLMLAPEPEAVALYCLANGYHALMEPGSRFIVISADTSTVEITSLQYEHEGTFSRLCIPSSNKTGWEFMDRFFVNEVLRDLFGSSFVDSLLETYVRGYHRLKEAWKRATRDVSMASARQVRIPLPAEVFAQVARDKTALDRIRDRQDGDETMIIISADKMRKAFETAVPPIIDAVSGQLGQVQSRTDDVGPKIALLVGESAEYPYLQVRLREYLDGKGIALHVPPRPSGAVMFGAVHFAYARSATRIRQ